VNDHRGHILIADDDASYLATMAELLGKEGYAVTTARDGAEAHAAAEIGKFDLLLADLEMPGNEDLSLVRGVAGRHGNLPIIIVTGFPSLRSTMACIELPVVAYLLKPVAFDDLLARVAEATERYRAFRRADERLDQWRQDLAHATTPKGGSGPAGFMRLALRNVMGSLTDVEEVASRSPVAVQASPHTCQQLNCPRGAQLVAAVSEVVFVLEETRSAFKSTQLRDLRRKLMLLLEHQ
jgi:CheY-like chemotaxis protein